MPSMPPRHPALLDPKQVFELVGLSEPTIWRMRERGEFPQPVKASSGRRVYYSAAEIEAWVQRRLQRQPEAAHA